METTTAARKLRGRIHEMIPIADVRQGDFVEYVDNGHRWGRVAKVHRGRKLAWVRVEAIRFRGLTLVPARRLDLGWILTAWRRKAA